MKRAEFVLMFAKKRPLICSFRSGLEQWLVNSQRVETSGLSHSFCSLPFEQAPTTVSLVRVLNAPSACAVNSPFVEARKCRQTKSE